MENDVGICSHRWIYYKSGLLKLVCFYTRSMKQVLERSRDYIAGTLRNGELGIGLFLQTPVVAHSPF